MTHSIDFHSANSTQIEAELGRRLRAIRIGREITQQQLAELAGVRLNTVHRLENGRGVSLDTFIRVMTGLGLNGDLESLLPETDLRPLERVQTGGVERQRARPKPSTSKDGRWTWGDEK
jgi:transcriptional regulator with XRE-family HTH domain